MLARHAVLGEAWDLALKYLRAAGKAAFTNFAEADAVAYFERALDVLQHLPGSKAHLEARHRYTVRPAQCTGPDGQATTHSRRPLRGRAAGPGARRRPPAGAGACLHQQLLRQHRPLGPGARRGGALAQARRECRRVAHARGGALERRRDSPHPWRLPARARGAPANAGADRGRRGAGARGTGRASRGARAKPPSPGPWPSWAILPARTLPPRKASGSRPPRAIPTASPTPAWALAAFACARGNFRRRFRSFRTGSRPASGCRCSVPRSPPTWASPMRAAATSAKAWSTCTLPSMPPMSWDV